MVSSRVVKWGGRELKDAVKEQCEGQPYLGVRGRGSPCSCTEGSTADGIPAGRGRRRWI